MNGVIFRTYVARVPAPTLMPGDIVILDNLASHKVAESRRLIEVRGALKFVIKTVLFRCSLAELPTRRGLWRDYVKALFTGGRISRFRDKRDAWGTHFGFDYRDVDDILAARAVQVTTYNNGIMRFYDLRRFPWLDR